MQSDETYFADPGYLSAGTLPRTAAYFKGHAMLGLRSDWQEHMARSASEIGVQGLRSPRQ